MKKSFNPKMLPLELSNDILVSLYKKVVEAKSKLTEFSVLLDRNIISKNLIRFFSLNESVQSTRIEGTQATFDEVMEANVTNKYNTDMMEVINYINALNKGEELLKRIPISTRLILEIHKEILKDGRGQNRLPGEYRKIQNWIGPTTKIEDATYIPPSPEKLGEYISNLEKYINDEIEDDIDPLIKIAVIHAQFESIHPFLDGNGRVGRILIMLYLLDKNIINKPIFFISEELEKNKYKYYSMLNNLRTENPKWKEWILFFLDSVVNQAEKNIKKLLDIESLFKIMIKYARENNIKQEFVEILFKMPVFNIRQIQEELGVSYSASRSNINKLLDSGKIYTNDSKRNKIYYFVDLMDILRK